MNQTSCGFRIGRDAPERCPHDAWRGEARTRMSSHSGAVTQWLELRTVHKENPGSNPVLLCYTLGKICSLCIVPVHSVV